MRLHTDVIEMPDIHKAVAGLPGVYVTVSQHGSRSHTRAFEVSLEGNGYRKNSGYYGAGDTIGATWDEWGVFIARLYDIDPEALWGSAKYPVYRHSYHFHEHTGDRFESLEMPADTHKRHNWSRDRITGNYCSKCSAVRYF